MHAAPVFAIFAWLLAAAGNITNAVNKADGMGQWAVYFIRCLCLGLILSEFVITEAQTHGPGCGAAFWCSEHSVIPLSYPVLDVCKLYGISKCQ